MNDRGRQRTKIHKDSHSIRKSSSVGPILQARQPEIICVRPPEVIHADPQDFMELVQRLTGSSPSEKSSVKREAEVEVFRPLTLTPSDPMTDCMLDRNVNQISPLAADDDPRDRCSITVAVCAKLEEELGGDNPPNTTRMITSPDS